MATRWGILSCGKISQDFVTALKHLNSDEHQVAAVAARHLNSAQEFAKRFSVPRAYGSYKELAEDPEIDVVYVATIHPYHYECSKLMLSGGKSVLCEKPLCMNAKQVTELCALAKERKLFLMEGLWTRFFPVYDQVRDVIASGAIGDPVVLHASFGAELSVDRVTQKNLGGGSLLDLGVYTVQLADMILGKPETITALSTMLATGVDETTVVTLRYHGNKMAVLTCSIACKLTNTCIIQGTKGIIEIPHQWAPTEMVINGEVCRFPLPDCSLPLNFVNSQGFMYEAEHVRKRLLKGDLESPLMTHESSLNIVSIMDEARRQMDLRYEADA